MWLEINLCVCVLLLSLYNPPMSQFPRIKNPLHKYGLKDINVVSCDWWLDLMSWSSEKGTIPGLLHSDQDGERVVDKITHSWGTFPGLLHSYLHQCLTRAKRGSISCSNKWSDHVVCRGERESVKVVGVPRTSAHSMQTRLHIMRPTQTYHLITSNNKKKTNNLRHDKFPPRKQGE